MDPGKGRYDSCSPWLMFPGSDNHIEADKAACDWHKLIWWYSRWWCTAQTHIPKWAVATTTTTFLITQLAWISAWTSVQSELTLKQINHSARWLRSTLRNSKIKKTHKMITDAAPNDKYYQQKLISRIFSWTQLITCNNRVSFFFFFFLFFFFWPAMKIN